MKKYMKIICFFLLSINFCSCTMPVPMIGPGLSDYSYKLPLDYVLVHGSVNDTVIYGKDGVGIIVGSMVTGIAWDKDFILVQQKGNKNIRGVDFIDISYWIIEVKTKILDGPYDSYSDVDFDSKKKQLGVSPKLKLEDPEKYKYLNKENG